MAYGRISAPSPFEWLLFLGVTYLGKEEETKLG